MKKIPLNKLSKILISHEKWLESNRKSGKQALLSGYDLNNSYLSCVNLKYANLTGSNLKHARLKNADLSNCNLDGADLFSTNLIYANLRRANLSGADLWGSHLWHANLRYANLSKANFHLADLSGADLTGADLRGARLSTATFKDTKGIMYFSLGKGFGFYTPHNRYCQIGCEGMEIDDWIESYEKLGRKHRYSKSEIELYGVILKGLSQYNAK